jgi:hypothetical protein
MAVTMIDPYQIVKTPFSESHLLSKLKKIVLVVRTRGISDNQPSFLYKVSAIDLSPEVMQTIEHDYNTVRDCIGNDPAIGFKRLHSKMGTYIQPRTKGSGHGSTSRAFYARKSFLNLIAPLNQAELKQFLEPPRRI